MENNGKWFESENIDQSYVSDKVKTFTNDDGSCNIGELLKSYDSAQKYIGGAVKIPNENATADEMSAFYSKLGRPEKASDYDWKQPDGIELQGEQFENFKEQMHSLGMTNKQVSGVLDGYSKIVLDIFKAQETAKAQQEAETLQALKKEWGDDCDAKLKGVMDTFEKLGIKNDLAEMGKLYDMKFIKAFHQISVDSQGTKIQGSEGTTQTVEARIKEIQNDPAYLNAGDPRHNALIQEFRELCKQR